MPDRIFIKDLKEYIGQEVTIAGWVDVRRDQGKMVFFDFRDMSGKVQGVVLPKSGAMEMAQKVRTEWVLEVQGKVNGRPEKNINKDQVNGDIELEFLDQEGFFEIETPILTKSTPEGARDYVVPSRLEKGKFYALPQSPQQYKQLLMASGVEKYFQIARCMRDEDTRGDRQPGFTQLDLGISFVEQEDVMELNEKLLIDIVKKLYPEKEIQEIPFPRISYKEAMEKYGNDRPDLRKDSSTSLEGTRDKSLGAGKNNPNLLAFCWVIDFPFFEKTA